MLSKRITKITKGKKCDYCDDFAAIKIKEDDLYTYLCEWCSQHQEQAKNSLPP
ncbi:MAG TPA: hypothetical protein VFE88_03290 [Candidatus Nanoarchaeia archaeon]|nr:hypothetical protein [Candidatus Nanoarchaeia archaeon]